MFSSPDMESLIARMARIKEGVVTSEVQTNRQTVRVSQNPNLKSNANREGFLDADDFNSDLGGAVTLDNKDEPADCNNPSVASTRDMNVKDGTKLQSGSASCTTSLGELNNVSMVNPSSTYESNDNVSDNANLPHGDGVKVTSSAGKFRLIDDEGVNAKSSNEAPKVQSKKQTGHTPNVQPVEGNPAPKSYVGATNGTNANSTKRKANFRPFNADNVFNGVDVSIPMKVVENISTKLEYTL